MPLDCSECEYEFEPAGYPRCLNCDPKTHDNFQPTKITEAHARLVEAYNNVGDTMSTDVVKNPKHYKLGDLEAIDIIKAALTAEQYKGYIIGSILKYRLRAGKKDDTLQDIGKALQYESFYEVHFG